MDWIQDLARYLPERLLRQRSHWDKGQADAVTELHLRAGGIPLGFSGGRLWEMDQETLSPEEISRMVSAMMEYTPAVRRQERQQGYLSLPGGYRVGLCGIARQEGGEVRVQEVTSVCIRIRRRVEGCSLELLRRIYPRGGRLLSCIVASAPGMGKTTILRDAARQLGCGFEGRGPLKVAVVDERGEFGTAQEYEGSVDILTGVGKVQGVTWLLRSMSPQVILVDEIGSAEDAQIVREALHCGVMILATAHAGSLQELEARQSLKELCRQIPCKVILSGAPGRIAQWEVTP